MNNIEDMSLALFQSMLSKPNQWDCNTEHDKEDGVAWSYINDAAGVTVTYWPARGCLIITCDEGSVPVRRESFFPEFKRIYEGAEILSRHISERVQYGWNQTATAVTKALGPIRNDIKQTD